MTTNIIIGLNKELCILELLSYFSQQKSEAQFVKLVYACGQQTKFYICSYKIQ